MRIIADDKTSEDLARVDDSIRSRETRYLGLRGALILSIILSIPLWAFIIWIERSIWQN